MKKCGIICEFNPFHNGHQYIIQKTKEMFDAEIICLMSGNFSQHGEPTIQEKHLRAQHAISAGASMVLELPIVFACSNAENFAFGAIKILKALNIDYLVFGIEKTDIDILKKIAKIKYENSIKFQNYFKNEIENGIPFNQALKRAIISQVNIVNIEDVLSKPNNILAIEYITAIYKLNAKIEPIGIERCDNGFSSKISKDNFTSATEIRKKILNKEDVSSFIPKFVQLDNIFNKSKIDDFNLLTIHKLRDSSPNELEKIYDFSEGIEYRIKEKSNKYFLFNDLIKNIASARYKVNRVKKLLIYPLFNITKSIEKVSKLTKPATRCLAIKKDKKILISKINKNKINVIFSNKDYNLLNKNQLKIIQIDLTASNIYNEIMHNENNYDKKIGTIFM